MSRWINTDQKFLPFVANALDYVPTAAATIVSEFDDVAPVASFITDSYNGHSAYVHLWIAPGRRPSRMFWFAIYHYIWQQLACKMVLANVASSNTKAQRLDAHLGFQRRGFVEGYYPNGDDMILYVATPYTIPDWRKWQPSEFKIAA